MKTKLILVTIMLLTPVIIKAEESTVRINEIAWMGTENSANDEWLELYNSTDNDIDLTGWRLEATDGSPAINLEGLILASGYFLLERTDDDSAPDAAADQIYTGSMSNTGEWLKLYDGDNNLVDEVNGTDGWPAGDNTTKQTMERSSVSGWQTSLEIGGTAKAENSTADPDDEGDNDDEDPDDEDDNKPAPPPTNNARVIKKGEIIINEIFPNPQGVDLEDEFIEIKNVSDRNIDLTNWTITNRAKQNFSVPSLIMMPSSAVVFYRPQTNLALNNLKEKITIYSKKNKIIDRVEYNKKAPENQSFQRQEKNKFFWDDISPGIDNIFETEILPVPFIDGPKKTNVGEIISLDASDSFDPENRKLTYFWDFGNGRTDSGVFVRQIYSTVGDFEIILKIMADENASSTIKLKIEVDTGTDQDEPVAIPTNISSIITPSTHLAEFPFIFISEFLPNPKGPDGESEFIEIFSNHDKPVNLAGWQLDDVEGGSKPYIIPDTIIKPGQYLTFSRVDTKIALNNSDEEVRLFTPGGVMVDFVDYEESKEGVSLVLDEQFIWQQSNTPTPGEINTLDNIEDEEKEGGKKKDADAAEPKVLGVKTEDIIKNNEPKNKNKYIVSGVSALVIVGLGTILKLKK